MFKWNTLSADWKDISSEGLVNIQNSLTSFGLFVQEVDTGSDQITAIISNQEISPERAQKLYDDLMQEMDE